MEGITSCTRPTRPEPATSRQTLAGQARASPAEPPLDKEPVHALAAQPGTPDGEAAPASIFLTASTTVQAEPTSAGNAHADPILIHGDGRASGHQTFLLGHVPDQAAELGAEERPGAADGGGGLAEGSADAGVLVTLLFEHPAAELSDGDLAPLRGHSTVTVPGCSTLHQWRQRVAPMDITVDAGTVAERAPRSRNVTSRDGA